MLRLRLFAILAVLLMPAATFPMPAATDRAPAAGAVGFVPDAAPLAVVPVRVNRQGPYAFLIDTGSSHSSIDADLAAVLAAPRVAKARVSSSTGDEWTAVVRLDRLDVGPLTSFGVLASEVPRPRLAALAPVAGVLGLDVLGAASFTLDYANGRIAWPGDAPASGAAVLPLTRVGEMWLVAAGVAGRTRLLMLDSGADSLVLFGRAGRGIDWRSGAAEARSVVGVRPMHRGTLPVLQLGPLRLLGVPVAGTGEDPGAAHGDGLLPLHLFERVTVDPGAALVTLAPYRSTEERRRPSAE